MLRLDKTVSRKTTLHADHDDDDAELRARWETRTPEQRQEILDFLAQQARVLQAFRNANPDNPPTHELVD